MGMAAVVIGLGIIWIVHMTFSASFNRIYDLLLEKDITQTGFTSKYVTKLIETELENVIANLQVSQELFLKTQDMNTEMMTETLKELRVKLKFDRLAVCDLNGDGINWEGNTLHIDRQELLSAVSAGRYYISADVSERNSIIMAVPIMSNRTPVGVLCGHYHVERIAEAIELDANSHRYFQLVDNSGRYISNSNNINSFARGDDIWKEIMKYQLSDGITVEEIRQNMETGCSGAFHFSYNGQGRYVSYEPLGINNWYVFSVLTEDYVTGYVKEIEKICNRLLWGFWGCITVVFALMVWEAYRTLRRVREQNEQLITRNALLFMALKHTNDIPFEADFDKRTVSMYHMEDQGQMVVNHLEEYFPDYLLEHKILSSVSSTTYRHIFNNMMHQKEMEPETIRVRIEDRWQWMKVHYRIINQSQIVGFLENYDE